jgi:hypothetical protein
MSAYFIWYGTVANLLVSCRGIKGQVVSGIFWLTRFHPPCFGFLVHLVFSIWKFISRSLTTTRLDRSVSFLFNRTIRMKQIMSRATTMVNEAPHPTIRPYVQYQRLSIALFSSVSGFIGYLWYRRFFHCFINNIGDRFTWSTDGLIRFHPIGQRFNIIRFTPKVMAHCFSHCLVTTSTWAWFRPASKPNA